MAPESEENEADHAVPLGSRVTIDIPQQNTSATTATLQSTRSQPFCCE
jgi:hypothetical protein